MSDHDTPHDPIDRTYAQAEAMLDDEAARAARRARVLGAVESDAAAAPVVSPPKRRVSWAAGGWLAAASVVGVSTLVAVQLSTPPVMQRPSPAAETPVAGASAPAPAPTPAPSPATAPAVEAPPPPARAAPPAQIGPSADVAAPSAFPAPPSQVAGPPVAAPAAPSPPPPPSAMAQAPKDSVEALVVTGEAAAPPPMARAQSAKPQAPPPASPAVQAARLHAAAAAGDLAELTALLAQGTPVDAPNRDGETALMKSIQARRPAAAALLRRHGASLDRPDRTGASARDMAVSIDDPDLNRALGLEP